MNQNALNTYNAHYNNILYRDLTSRLQDLVISDAEHIMLCNLLIDAALEVSGESFYAGSVALFMSAYRAICSADWLQQLLHVVDYLRIYDPGREISFTAAVLGS